jgi:sporulation protein YlmC with PRC-barrel domain
MRVELGAPVHCDGRLVGEAADVVIDRTTLRLTHVVVAGVHTVARLVPVELIRGEAGSKQLELACSSDELHALEPIREFAFLRYDEFPAPDEQSDIGVEDMTGAPYLEAGELAGYTAELEPSAGVTYDRIPKGEAELRRVSEVVSADGERLGHVAAFEIGESGVAQLVLERGHLWGTRDVTIPVDAVDDVANDRVTLTLDKDAVGALPSVRVHHLPFTG